MFTVVFITLLDGSTVNLKVPSTTVLDFKTDYGNLKIPLAQVRECVLGVHVDNPTWYEGLYKQLASDNHAYRDVATKALRANPRGAYLYLKTSQATDAETMRRVELLLKEYASFPPLYDSIVTTKGTFTGLIQQKVLCGDCVSIGTLDVKLSQIASLSVGLPKTTLTVTPGPWVEVGRVSGRVKIKAGGTVELWSQTPGQWSCNPNGHESSMNGTYRAGALIGRINGREFLVGDNLDANLGQGVLELKINNSVWVLQSGQQSMSGSYEVEVSQ